MEIFSPLVEHAIELSAQWHDATYRKSRWREAAFEPPVEDVLRVPAMAHVTAVALIVQRAGWEDVVVAAAFLHDALEDANRYGQPFRHEQLLALMGEAVTTLVATVSEQKLDADGRFRRWRDRKDGYIAQLQRGAAGTAAISLADKLHNLWSINQSLAQGHDVFSPGPNRKALSAGPADQLWFHQTVLDASRVHADPRLIPMRQRVQAEIDRFVTLTA